MGMLLIYSGQREGRCYNPQSNREQVTENFCFEAWLREFLAQTAPLVGDN